MMRLKLLFLVAGTFSSSPPQVWPRRIHCLDGWARPLSLAGAVATPPLFPAPLVLVTGEDEGAPKISCIAPRHFAGSTFELFVAGAGMAVQSVTAAPDQHHAEFTLGGASHCYWCRYRSYNGSAWQISEFSVETVVNGAGGDLRGCAGSAAQPNLIPRCFSAASSDAGCRPATTAPTSQALPTSTALHQGTGTVAVAPGP